MAGAALSERAVNVLLVLLIVAVLALAAHFEWLDAVTLGVVG